LVARDEKKRREQEKEKRREQKERRVQETKARWAGGDNGNGRRRWGTAAAGGCVATTCYGAHRWALAGK